jgi:sporulation protein YlmC with PRC-barrel domain
VTSPSTGRMLASDIYKANVYDLSENKIGDVADLIIDSNGNVTAAIVSVGGFITVGQKEVMIPFKELKISTRDGKDWLTLNRTKDDLKMLPAFDKKAELNKM